MPDVGRETLRLPRLTHAQRRTIAVELHIAADSYADASMRADAKKLHALADRVYPNKRMVLTPPDAKAVALADLPLSPTFRAGSPDG